MSAKIRKKMGKGYSPDDYAKTFNPKSAEDISYLMEDLSLLYNSPIEKSFRMFHERKNKGFFPF